MVANGGSRRLARILAFLPCGRGKLASVPAPIPGPQELIDLVGMLFSATFFVVGYQIRTR
jgi:hypothetical protein